MLARAYILEQEEQEGINDFASPSDESVQKLVQLFKQTGDGLPLEVYGYLRLNMCFKYNSKSYSVNRLTNSSV